MQLKLAPMRALAGSVARIPDGVAGTRATLRKMWALTRPEKNFSMAVYQAARQITRHLPQKDQRGEVAALFHFVRDHIRYVNEYPEALQTPEATLQLGTGDCDDKVILLAALLVSIGREVKLVAGGRAPGNFEHVWLRVLLREHGRAEWVALDPTEPRPVGWEPPLPEKLVVG